MTGPRPVLHNGIGQPQGIWETATTPAVTVGTRASLPDGRVFYYARYSASSAIVPGELMAMEATDAQFQGLAVNTAAIGDTSLSITLGTVAVTAAEYDGGYVSVVDDTGEGVTYKIKSNPAVSASTAGSFALVDPVYVAFGAATTVDLIKNPWADVIQMPATGSQVAIGAGVPQVALADSSSTSTYVWLQTWGISCGERDDTSTIGQALTQGTTAGQFEAVSTTDTEPHMAVAVSTGVVNEHNPVFLTLHP